MPSTAEGSRFIVRENSGYAILPDGGQGSVERTEIMVMDRAYCHKVVWTNWNNERVMHLPLDKQRRHAWLVADHMERHYG